MTRIFFFVFFLIFLTSFSQVGPRVWQNHLSLNRSNTVSKLGPTIYASNGNDIVKFDEQELSPQSLSKINGLSDVSIIALRANPYNNKLLVIYQNCNIDVIDLQGNISNYPDFKIKPLNGKKTINEVTFYKQLAYLACGFGIVVFDTEKLEIKETYIIGPGGTDLEVYQTALNDSILFAATPNGLYQCNYKQKIPNNFNNWHKDTVGIPKGPYCGVVNVMGNIIAAYSYFKTHDTIMGRDTLFIYNNSSWSKFSNNPGPTTIRKMCMVDKNYFSFIDQFGGAIIDLNTRAPINYVTTYNGNPEVQIVDIFFGKDYASNYTSCWFADLHFGLYQTYGYYPYYRQNPYDKNGTNTTLISNIDAYNGQLAVSPSYVENAGGSGFYQEGINVLKNEEWHYIKINDPDNNYNLTGKAILDICHVLIDRKDTGTLWASSWVSGLLQIKHNSLVAVYTHTNTGGILPQAFPESARSSGLAMDDSGNLWISSSDVKNYLSVRRTNGSMLNYDFGTARFVRKIFIDKNNFIWILHEREDGITIFKHDDNFTNFQFKHISKAVGNGDLETDGVYSIAEDKDGKIWVGTSQGIRVFYNSAGIFDATNFDSEPIKIVQDGNVELLLGNETVTSIVIDGANNKWCGTESGGVYCFSPDGITQIYHFTKENSPLNSNSVIEMNYNEVTGDIFIGTDLGIQSFRSISVQGGDTYTDVFAYPNPVRPNYNGSVLVRGLVDKSIVKITDLSGNLVWETKSAGGQIEWPVTTLSGRRVVSGVYIVYASTTDGTQKALTKVLVIN